MFNVSLSHRTQEGALVLLMLFQSACTFFFVMDIIGDLAEMPPGEALTLHLSGELFANVGLVLAIIVEGLALRRLLLQQANAQRALSAAAGALNELMLAYFDDWGLTPAEADVATFTIKGYSIAEIARIRQSAEGTIKSQLNAIYRKSGLAGRGQLVSLLIEDLMSGPLPTPGASRPATEA